MNVVIFGASGMIGRGALIECLEDEDVESVLVVGRRTCEVTHPKLRELIHDDLFALSSLTEEFKGYEVCFFSIGVTSAGMSETSYRRITRDLTVAIVEALRLANPDLTVCFVSGQGSDSSEQGRIMWARVKGEAENALLAMPIATYVFRPGVIQPLKGVRSKTTAYQVLYNITGPLIPMLLKAFPRYVTTSVILGRAMIRAARDGYSKTVLEPVDINALGR